jgi:hypothetical protein
VTLRARWVTRPEGKHVNNWSQVAFPKASPSSLPPRAQTAPARATRSAASRVPPRCRADYAGVDLHDFHSPVRALHPLRREREMGRERERERERERTLSSRELRATQSYQAAHARPAGTLGRPWQPRVAGYSAAHGAVQVSARTLNPLNLWTDAQMGTFRIGPWLISGGRSLTRPFRDFCRFRFPGV